MNTTFKTTLALGAAGLSLLGMAGGAGAQITTGDPALSTAFSTYNGKGAPNYTGTAIGVGYDANGGGGKLSSSLTPATAQSVYEAFTFDSSASGPFTALAAGDLAQLEVFAANKNVNVGSNFDIYASLYAYNPNAAVGTVPVTGPNLFGAQQKITLAPAASGYFSGDFMLAGALTASDTYVLGITTLTGDTQDFANIGATAATQAGLTTSDFTFAKTKFVTDGNDQGNPSGQSLNTTIPQTNSVLAFKLDAAPAVAAVPEADTSVGFALGLGILGTALVAAKRRRVVAQ